MMSRNVRGFMSLFWSEKPVSARSTGSASPAARTWRCAPTCSWSRTREDRLSAGARLGGANHGAVGAPDRPGAGEAPVADRRLDRRRDRGRVGAGERVRSCGRARWRVRGTARARRQAADQPARDAQAARQPGGRRSGALLDAGARHLLRRDRPPHARGPRVRAPRRGEWLQGGGARTRRAVWRLRPRLDRGEQRNEGHDHQLADAVRAQHGAPARRRGTPVFCRR